MYRKLFIALFMLSVVPVCAQRTLMPLNSQYIFNGLLINPAYAGSHDVLSMAGTFRKQWVGFDGAPQDYSFGLHAPLEKSTMGIGFLFRNEQMLNQKTSEAGFDYAYRFVVGKGKMAFGLRGQMDIFSENPFSGDLENSSDPVFTENSSHGTILMPNFGVGMFYFTDKFYCGASIPQLFNLPEEKSLPSFLFGESNTSYYNYIVTGGLYLGSSKNFRFKPSVLLKYQQASGLQYDLNASAVFLNETLWLGGSYRSDGSLIAILEFQIRKQLKLGLSWDYPTGTIRQATVGSAELSVRYDFDFKVNAYNPMFF